MLLGAYRNLSALAPPVLRLLLRRRLARGKEDGARIGERMGVAARARPAGELGWVHGASVGEALAALALIERVLARLPAAHVLVTTGTVTSARLMGQRLPPRALHQFAPVDAAPWVAQFLDHWRPDLALWIESELWPNLLLQSAARGIPLALLNARLSERSFRGWRRWPAAARRLLASFRLVLAQTELDAGRYRALGAAPVAVPGNLKYAAPPLPADEAKLGEMRARIGARPVWLAASIHPGEDTIVAAAQRVLGERVPGALALVVPRHPEKGAAMQAAMARAGAVAGTAAGTAPALRIARRGAGEALAADTDIYIADTLGELGLFYRLAGAAFVGGSFIPHGGQNPIEPAALGVAVLHGPHMENFAPVIANFDRLGAARRVADSASLAGALADILGRPETRARMGAAARQAAEAERGVIERVMAALETLLAPLAGRGTVPDAAA
jgi:3-deoxy-D-manno-octulosonic-acid transferase